MRSPWFLVLPLVVATASLGSAQERSPARVVITEDSWVAFYDVPSRRFRTIRSDFVQRKFAAAAIDLSTSATHLAIEASRSTPAISSRLSDVSDELVELADNIESESITVTQLDAIFGRAHWLLAQHYLASARRSRDRGDFRAAGLYLWATTHHLERAVLWSNARIDRKLHRTLESLRQMATQIQDEKTAAAVIREKPLLRAEALLVELGKVIDRPVVMKLSEPPPG